MVPTKEKIQNFKIQKAAACALAAFLIPTAIGLGIPAIIGIGGAALKIIASSTLISGIALLSLAMSCKTS